MNIPIASGMRRRTWLAPCQSISSKTVLPCFSNPLTCSQLVPYQWPNTRADSKKALLAGLRFSPVVLLSVGRISLDRILVARPPHMSRLRKAATFCLRFVTQLKICWGYPRHQKSAWNALFHEKIASLLVNHHDHNILEAQPKRFISLRKPSLQS